MLIRYSLERPQRAFRLRLPPGVPLQEGRQPASARSAGGNRDRTGVICESLGAAAGVGAAATFIRDGMRAEGGCVGHRRSIALKQTWLSSCSGPTGPGPGSAPPASWIGPWRAGPRSGTRPTSSCRHGGAAPRSRPPISSPTPSPVGGGGPWTRSGFACRPRHRPKARSDPNPRLVWWSERKETWTEEEGVAEEAGGRETRRWGERVASSCWAFYDPPPLLLLLPPSLAVRLDLRRKRPLTGDDGQQPHGTTANLHAVRQQTEPESNASPHPRPDPGPLTRRSARAGGRSAAGGERGRVT